MKLLSVKEIPFPVEQLWHSQFILVSADGRLLSFAATPRRLPVITLALSVPRPIICDDENPFLPSML